jgi:hypothetical protein
VVAYDELILPLEKVQQSKSQINGNFAQLFLKDRFGSTFIKGRFS